MLQELYKRFRFSELQKFSDSFLNGHNISYLDGLYERWLVDKSSVPATWDAYFRSIQQDTHLEYIPEPKSQSDHNSISRTNIHQNMIMATHFKIRLMINQYRTYGHLRADLNPLNQQSNFRQSIVAVQCDMPKHLKVDVDLNSKYLIQDFTNTNNNKVAPLWQLNKQIETLESIYCGKIVMNIQWIQNQIEIQTDQSISKEQKLKTFDRLCKESCFSNYLQRKFNTLKRFGVEGCDSMISGLQRLVDVAAAAGAEHIVFGMAHRGRLNTLYNVFQKSAEEIMVEFQDLKGNYHEDIWGNSGDVKYHLGSIHNVKFGDKKVRLEMLPNPSHLEAVNPLVYGKVRAIQDYLKDDNLIVNDPTGESVQGSCAQNQHQVFGVLIHDDAAISGQGIVYETLQLNKLAGYQVGGTIHIVFTNQIGFNNTVNEVRSGLYCTDIAKGFQAPVFHVNADEPELVDKVFQMATEFRNKFKQDVFIDLIGYRRQGHNEQDQPKFTQPIMYEKIEKTKPVFVKYSEKLIAQGVITQEFLNNKIKEQDEQLEIAFAKSRLMDYNIKDWQPVPWEMIKVPTQWGRIKDTAVPVNVLKALNQQINVLPLNIHPNPQIKKFYEDRYQAIIRGNGLDFAAGEALAFATLLHEGYSVRVSGEDVQRATFSHRHAVIKDYQNPDNNPYVPLASVLNGQNNRIGTLNILLDFYNSPLSEYSVLGFDYGYSLANQNCLVCWEAQYGDFANAAQIIIDNYIASAESKWGVNSGIVLLLPTGMDGHGPEHSCARHERFLSLCNDDPQEFMSADQIQNINMQIVQCSTPANYFHVLRRQLRREFRKPLIAMTPKRLLRLAAAKSSLAEFSENSKFEEVYDDPDTSLVNPQQIKQVILCSGQVYYDLVNRRKDRNLNDVAIVRIEQLAPFPYLHLQEVIKRYSTAKFTWVQEEHQNQGPWHFIRPRIQMILKMTSDISSKSINYVGRKPSSQDSTGYIRLHEYEIEQFLSKAFQV